MPHGPDDIATRGLDPAEVIRASRGAWRRAVADTICESTRLIAAKDTTTAERVRLAALCEVLVRAIEVV